MCLVLDLMMHKSFLPTVLGRVNLYRAACGFSVWFALLVVFWLDLEILFGLFFQDG